jgi:hypothetical protein
MLVTHQLRYYILEEVRNEVDTLPDVRARDGVKRDVSMVLLSGPYLYLVSEEGAWKTRSAKVINEAAPIYSRHRYKGADSSSGSRGKEVDFRVM